MLVLVLLVLVPAAPMLLWCGLVGLACWRGACGPILSVLAGLQC
jgi:hypothetical protein